MALDDLKGVIEQLQGMINVHHDYLSRYETRTRQVLIDPLLQALGWDVWDPGTVQLEYKLREERSERADYGLMWNNKPIAVVEAKHLGKSLKDKETTQANIYANENGIPYIIVTDGDRWEMYEVFKQAALEERLLMVFQLSKQPSHECALQALRMWKPNLASGSPKEAMGSVIESAQSASDPPSNRTNELKKEQHPQPTPTPDPSADPDNSFEQSTDDEDSEPEGGKTLILEDKEKRKTHKPKCKNYRACLDKCLEILSEIRRERFEEVLDFRLEGQQRPYFSKNPDDLIGPREIGETGVYIYGHFSADRIRKIVEKVAKYFGCKASIEE